jgi:hypothetical protein
VSVAAAKVVIVAAVYVAIIVVSRERWWWWWGGGAWLQKCLWLVGVITNAVLFTCGSGEEAFSSDAFPPM